MPGDIQKWDPRKMFDLSEKDMSVFAKRKQMVEERKMKFRFDPALQRWFSARHTIGENFKPNIRSTKYLFFTLILPVTLLTYLVHNQRVGNCCCLSYYNTLVVYINFILVYNLFFMPKKGDIIVIFL
ncbi:hypothetical protein MAR_019386 [Mya arenaria]|uniref:NADH dehydrogenase [ubiquinone] 1 beta subcomplex subunit 4 n=1 Tax=Mya arenaria TaxID=6604 RepID=A0ABY7ELB8_MYAAR|nr:hypothetical protein MAR_019386 [Mya arenaria]